MKLTKAQKEWIRDIKIEYQGYEDTRSATEIIEQEIAQDIQAHRTYDLFERLVRERDYDKARKVGWMLFFDHNINVFED